jgi:hypothetical protein
MPAEEIRLNYNPPCPYPGAFSRPCSGALPRLALLNKGKGLHGGHLADTLISYARKTSRRTSDLVHVHIFSGHGSSLGPAPIVDHI